MILWALRFYSEKPLSDERYVFWPMFTVCRSHSFRSRPTLFFETDCRFPLPDGSWLAGSRGYDRKATTDLWWLDPETGKFTDLVMLPSGGDTSYPGFVVDTQNQRVLVSYYSSHEGKAAIYLAILRLDVFGEE